jgi:nucleoside-diphosphate-sugar epimerase
VDVTAPTVPDGLTGRVVAEAADLSAPGVPERLVADRPDVIFHLAAIVSGEAEVDFDKGYRVNLDGSRALFDAIRARATGARGSSSPPRSRSSARPSRRASPTTSRRSPPRATAHRS